MVSKRLVDGHVDNSCLSQLLQRVCRATFLGSLDATKTNWATGEQSKPKQGPLYSKATPCV
jgi:hypothetical protein